MTNPEDPVAAAARKAMAHRLARKTGLDGDALYQAAEAIRSSLGPQGASFIEWTYISVTSFQSRGEGSAQQSDFYKVWKKGFPELCAYGTSVREAIANMLNTFGE